MDWNLIGPGAGKTETEGHITGKGSIPAFRFLGRLSYRAANVLFQLPEKAKTGRQVVDRMGSVTKSFPT